MLNFNETITLYIEDTSIRLMVSQGMKIKKKAEVKLEPGLVKGAVVLKEKEVAARITELLKSQEVVGKKVLLGFSGLHSLTRPMTLPELPKSMVPEAVAREARRVLPVPLDQLYLSWRTVPSVKGRIQAFMAANPRKAIDSLMKTLHIADLEASHMTIKPLALTKAVPENTAIIIDLQSTEFDITILSDGIPQPIRTITLPEAELTLEQKMDSVISDLDRTIKFFDENNKERPLNKAAPLYVSGEFMGHKDIYKMLAESSGHPVKALSSSIKGLEETDLGVYMINIAMAIKNAPPSRESTFPISNLNMLPAPYQPKPISYSKLIAIPGAAAIIGVVVPMFLLMQSASANIDKLQTELETANAATNQKISEQQALGKNIAVLEKQSAAAKQAVNNVAASWKVITTQQEIVSGDLTTALVYTPVNVTIGSITESGGTLTVTGSATDEATVLNYARALDASKRFAQTTVSSLTLVAGTAETAESFEFTLTMIR
jgi:type IV pilus assembly protein PilM